MREINNESFVTAARVAPNPPAHLTRAFSSEVDTGSREENASEQETRASVPIQSERKLWSVKMDRQRASSRKMSMARRAAFAIALAALVASCAHSAEARGRHGFGRGGHGVHGAHFTSDRRHRHGNDAYAKAASEETDKLLKTKIKSICRGC
ncbi:MAG TPA: hypothetical protein VNS33_12105 [Bradyrhizobium sp.]|nr:hypothetical protein [Bradyrhizobium sp.]